MFRRAILDQVTQAFESGDFRPLLEHLDENVIWKSAVRVGSGNRPGGDYRGRLGVIEITSQICMAVTYHRFRLIEAVQSEGLIWALFDTLVSPADHEGDRLQYETALRVRFVEDRIVEIQAFFDTGQLSQFLAAQALAQPNNV